MPSLREQLADMEEVTEAEARRAEQKGNATEANRIREWGWRNRITEALCTISEQIERADGA